MTGWTIVRGHESCDHYANDGGSRCLRCGATRVERCPQCDGPIERVIIGDRESWACPRDAYAYAVDQDALDDDALLTH